MFPIPTHGDLPLNFTLPILPDTESSNINQWEEANEGGVFNLSVRDPLTNPWFEVWVEGVLSLPHFFE